MLKSNTDNDYFVDEAVRLVNDAQKKGILLRILGSTGFRIHSPEFIAIHSAMDRPMTDIDFVAYSKQDREFDAFFKEENFVLQQAALTPELYATRRIFNHKTLALHVDIFLDDLSMCHTIHFKNRLEVDSPTIPLAELVLEKTQIVTLADKDIKDMLILLAAHPMGDHDNDTINVKYISDILSKDWGFYYTTLLSLKKIRANLPRFEHMFQPEHVTQITERLGQLENAIEQAPKSLKWKARAAIGTKIKWYTDVDEVERAEHLQDKQ